MKKMLSMALLMALIIPQAFATKARLIALGMDELDNEGSYYIEDSRNIFLNVANINDYADTLIFEWGEDGLFPTAGGNNNDSASYDTDASPKAQGGFLKSHENFVYGLYLGNESNTSSLLKILSTAKSAAPSDDFLDTSDNQVDLFFGSNHNGMDWGLNLVYTKSDFESTDSEDQGYAIRLGAKTEQWNVFVNSSLSGESKRTFSSGTENQEFDGSIGLHIGGGYNVTDEGRVYGYFKSFGWDQKDSARTIVADRDVEASFTTYSLGYGHVMEQDSGRLFTDIHMRKRDIEVEFADASKVDELIVPLTIGYEAEATSWLTLRGSVRHNLYGVTKNDNYSELNPVIASLAGNIFGSDTSGKKSTIRNSTTVNAGASLTFGSLVVDGVIGTTLNSATPQARVNSSSLNLDEALARVGATYSF